MISIRYIYITTQVSIKFNVYGFRYHESLLSSPFATMFCKIFLLNSFKYQWALPSIQIGNENLKLGYAIAHVLLKTPSMASCGHEPSCRAIDSISNERDNFERHAYGTLPRHYEFHGFFNGVWVRILGVHERHDSPARLHDLRIIVLNPSTLLARLCPNAAWNQWPQTTRAMQGQVPCNFRQSRRLLFGGSKGIHRHVGRWRLYHMFLRQGTSFPVQTASRTSYRYPKSLSNHPRVFARREDTWWLLWLFD